MDKQKLIALIVERHGIKLDPHDPAFLIVDLNLLMLEGHAARLQQLGVKIAELPDSVEGRLKQQTNALLDAADEMQARLGELTEAVGKEIKGSTDASVSIARKQMYEAAATAVRKALEDADIEGKISGAVQKITDAANSLEVQAGALEGRGEKVNARIDKASKRVSWSAYKLAAVVAGASLATTLFGGFIVLRASAQPAAALSPADAKALVDGRALAKAWPSLTPRERERITELAK